MRTLVFSLLLVGAVGAQTASFSYPADMSVGCDAKNWPPGWPPLHFRSKPKIGGSFQLETWNSLISMRLVSIWFGTKLARRVDMSSLSRNSTVCRYLYVYPLVKVFPALEVGHSLRRTTFHIPNARALLGVTFYVQSYALQIIPLGWPKIPKGWYFSRGGKGVIGT